jgi:hypothetical protein
MFEVEDYQGNVVRLYAAQWKSHILRNHPEMEGALEGLKLTISDPDVVVASTSRGRAAGCERVVASRLGAHPAHRNLYLRVVVEYDAMGKNWVCTSHVSPLPPTGELLYVRIPSR